MFYLITGYPGTGKSTLSFILGHEYSFKVVNDKEFSKLNNLGEESKKENEYIVDITKLNKEFSKFIRKNKNENIIFEGHLWGEMSKSNLMQFKKIVLLYTDPKLLRKRYEERNYSQIKIEENLFCEETKYIETILNSKGIKYILINTITNEVKNIKELKSKLNLK